MPNRLREYHRPSDLQTALSLLQSANHQALDLGPRPSLEPFANTEAVVDLSALNLNYITETADAISIGAQTPLQVLVESPVLQPLLNDLLPRAAKYAAHLGLRSIATLGATLASSESSPELHLALLALRALAVVQHKQRRTISLSVYDLDPDQILLEVHFAPPINARAALARVARSPLDIAIVAAVAVVTPTTNTVAVAGASPKPMVLQPSHRDALSDLIAAEANPTPDYRGSAEYRIAMASVLAKRAMQEAS